MKKVFLVSIMAVAASAVAADALAPIDGTAAVKVTRFAAAKAAQYRGGFARDGEEVVCYDLNALRKGRIKKYHDYGLYGKGFRGRFRQCWYRLWHPGRD